MNQNVDYLLLVYHRVNGPIAILLSERRKPSMVKASPGLDIQTKLFIKKF